MQKAQVIKKFVSCDRICGKKFMRIVQQAISSTKITWRQIKVNTTLTPSQESSLGLSA